MKIDIITPEKSLYRGQAQLVRLPGADGFFELLENHAPIIAALSHGEVKVVDAEGQKSYYSLKGGIVECSNNNVIVLAE